MPIDSELFAELFDENICRQSVGRQQCLWMLCTLEPTLRPRTRAMIWLALLITLFRTLFSLFIKSMIDGIWITLLLITKNFGTFSMKLKIFRKILKNIDRICVKTVEYCVNCTLIGDNVWDNNRYKILFRLSQTCVPLKSEIRLKTFPTKQCFRHWFTFKSIGSPLKCNKIAVNRNFNPYCHWSSFILSSSLIAWTSSVELSSKKWSVHWLINCQPNRQWNELNVCSRDRRYNYWDRSNRTHLPTNTRLRVELQLKVLKVNPTPSDLLMSAEWCNLVSTSKNQIATFVNGRL